MLTYEKVDVNAPNKNGLKPITIASNDAIYTILMNHQRVKGQSLREEKVGKQSSSAASNFGNNSGSSSPDDDPENTINDFDFDKIDLGNVGVSNVGPSSKGGNASISAGNAGENNFSPKMDALKKQLEQKRSQPSACPRILTIVAVAAGVLAAAGYALM
jgi:hypothetical protein